MVSKTAKFISVTAMLSVGAPISGTFVMRGREMAPADKLCSFSPVSTPLHSVLESQILKSRKLRFSNIDSWHLAVINVTKNIKGKMSLTMTNFKWLTWP